MSLAFNVGVTPFSGQRVGSRKENFPVQGFPVTTPNRSRLIVNCSLTTIDFMAKMKENFKREDDKFPTTTTLRSEDIPSNLCIIDTLQRLGVDQFFQYEINTILDNTFRLWQEKHKVIYGNVTTHAMAFRLLRVKGYEVSSEELAPYGNQEAVSQQTNDLPMIIELYRAANERIYEEERSLEKILAWTTIFLNKQVQDNSIPDKKLHKLVEFYLRNYKGITIRLGARRNLELYDMTYYQALKSTNRFSNLCNEDFLVFAKQDFDIHEAQNQKGLQQLQRWYADCRLDTLNFGRDVVIVANYLASLIIGDHAFDYVRLAFAKTSVLVTIMDDFFDCHGSSQECDKIIELVKEWKENPDAEYGSEELEILFMALYNTVNELAERARVEQGRSVKEFLVKLWVEILSAFKIELDTWSNGTQQSFDEYISSSWLSNGSRLTGLLTMQFIGVKLSDEMLMSEECTHLARHVCMVGRLLNDVCSSEREREENIAGKSYSILLATEKDGRKVSEDEAIAEINEMVEYHWRKVLQIVYKKESILPRRCKDVFLEMAKGTFYAYGINDELTSPQQSKEDMKSFVF